MTTDTISSRRNAADSSLCLSAILLLAGQVLFILVTQLHAGGDANEHRSIFATYAHSSDWKGVHAFQFLAVAITVAGLVALCSALEARTRRPMWAARIGAVLAVVSLALYGVLQAVDGIGNKQVDHAWASAADADRSARFASAEAMRWLEWGMSSYHAYALGLALVAFAVAMAAAGTDVPRTIATPTGLSGIACLAEGWVAGAQGFTSTHSILIIASWVFSLAWMTWLLVISRRAGHAVEARDVRR
ncbi:hypothetical protein GCM10009798_17980 [Nocardioides panacihumi]|uniref:DUF4386 family protein n=1 Tax=Nocardioides panacihumi TaxID=400774 RepID=A0ABN2QVB7_9ACTN